MKRSQYSGPRIKTHPMLNRFRSQERAPNEEMDEQRAGPHWSKRYSGTRVAIHGARAGQVARAPTAPPPVPQHSPGPAPLVRPRHVKWIKPKKGAA
jgi:hypothetical protein